MRSEGQVYGGSYTRFKYYVADRNAGVHIRLEAGRGALPLLLASFGAAPERSSATFYATVRATPRVGLQPLRGRGRGRGRGRVVARLYREAATLTRARGCDPA